MGCNCKNDKNNMLNKQDSLNSSNDKHDDEVKTLSLPYKIMYYGVKVFGFTLTIFLLPIINIAIIWFLFKTIVLNKNISLLNITKTLSRWKKVRDLELREEEEAADYKDFEESENEFLFPVSKIKSTIE